MIREDLSPHVQDQAVFRLWSTATDDNNKLRTRSNISIGTWNVRTLRPPGKLEELTHEMRRYHWSVLGLCELRSKNFGETTTQDGHQFYFSGKEDGHENGVGFLVHKDTVNTVMGCQPISSRLITIRLEATPFNITVVQAYAPTTDYDDEKRLLRTTSGGFRSDSQERHLNSAGRLERQSGEGCM